MEEIVRQFGYLPELYEDERSKKYKNKNTFNNISYVVRFLVCV
jgi:hypothetical protein